MHIFIGILLNKRLINIKFTLSGICATFEKDVEKERKVYLSNLLIYLSGPLANVLLSIIFYDNIMIREINIFLAVINILPVYPLDGYNIVIQVLKLTNKEIKRIKIIDKIGNMVIILLMALSMYQIIEYKKITILIFTFYVFTLKLISEKKQM